MSRFSDYVPWSFGPVVRLNETDLHNMIQWGAAIERLDGEAFSNREHLTMTRLRFIRGKLERRTRPQLVAGAGR